MPCKFDFDSSNKIIRCRIQGIVTDKTLKDYYRLWSKYGALNPTFAGIVDISAVTFLAVSTQTIRELAMQPAPSTDPALCVIVAGSDQMFGLAQMFFLQRSEAHPN